MNLILKKKIRLWTNLTKDEICDKLIENKNLEYRIILENYSFVMKRIYKRKFLSQKIIGEICDESNNSTMINLYVQIHYFTLIWIAICLTVVTIWLPSWISLFFFFAICVNFIIECSRIKDDLKEILDIEIDE